MKATDLSKLALSALVLAAAAIVACTSPSAAPLPTATHPAAPSPSAAPATASPTPSATLSPRPSARVVSVTSAAQAAALVFASDERWARMTPARADVIGGSTSYEASQDGDGFSVSITVGQGDCFAGCIEQHTWNYRVDADGTVELVGEDGDDVEVEQPAGGDGPARVDVQLTAGPTCPVERNPPDPNCAPRTVEGAELVVFDSAGTEVGRQTANADGLASFDLPAGAYYVVPSDVQGLMGTPDAQAFAVLGGDAIELLFVYDTGIR